MSNRLPYITLEKREGIKKLLAWCVEMYKNANGVNGKRMWYQKKEFLAELQKHQTYTEEDKVIFNGIRKEYIKQKTKR